MIRLDIIRFEGVSDQTEIEFSLSGKPLTQDSDQELSFLIPLSGYLKILLKSNRCFLFTSFHTDLLPNEGFQWIPLSSSPQFTLDSFPEDAGDPKILVMVTSEFVSQIEENSQVNCEECESLKTENIHLQQEMAKLAKESKSNQENLTAENEKNKLLLKKLNHMYSETKKELDAVKVILEEERKKNLELNDKVSSLTLLIEENSSKAKMREEFLEGLLNDREKEYRSLRSLNKSENVPPCSVPAGGIYAEPVGYVKDVSKEVIAKDRVQSKRKILNEISSQPCAKETEIALKKFLVKTNRKGLFVKDQGNMYRFGKKKIFITFKHGNLLCRVGGGFEAIEEFIMKNQDVKVSASPILEANHKRHKTVDNTGKFEESDEISKFNGRSSPEIEKVLKSRLRPMSGILTDYN